MKHRLLGNRDKGILFVLSAPAGTGKTTLVRMLTAEFPAVFENVSYTTRTPRAGEIEGKDYRFISREAFQNMADTGDFLEEADVFGELYGTSKKDVERRLQEGKHVVLVIDTQGAMKLKGKVEAVFIFIAPPSMEELRTRLFKRESDSEQSIKKRLSWAQGEMEKADRYDYIVVNENVQLAYETLRSIFIAEEHRKK